jgi:hypothetical protein
LIDAHMPRRIEQRKHQRRGQFDEEAEHMEDATAECVAGGFRDSRISASVTGVRENWLWKLGSLGRGWWKCVQNVHSRTPEKPCTVTV